MTASRELELYRKAVNEIDDRIEYTSFDRQAIYEILDRLSASLAALYGNPCYTITEAGRKALEGRTNEDR